MKKDKIISKKIRNFGTSMSAWKLLQNIDDKFIDTFDIKYCKNNCLNPGKCNNFETITTIECLLLLKKQQAIKIMQEILKEKE